METKSSQELITSFLSHNSISLSKEKMWDTLSLSEQKKLTHALLNQGHISEIKHLVQTGLIRQKKSLRSLFFRAIRNGQEEMVLFLLSKCDPLCKNGQAYKFAIEGHHHSILKLLLAHVSTSKMALDIRSTLLVKTISCENIPALIQLKKKFPENFKLKTNDLFRKAASENKEKMWAWFFSQKIKIEEGNYATLFFHAFSHQHIHLLKCFIEKMSSDFLINQTQNVFQFTSSLGVDAWQENLESLFEMLPESIIQTIFKKAPPKGLAYTLGQARLEKSQLSKKLPESNQIKTTKRI